ncbi:unnamed protein product [Parnassius apollo]|uniref:(apollo) hypothetical protein n=1 Tax=Parnassius apollo TaxID=110799 RepID=A0A8S3X1L9_PARAO|nr:unnamed protein product [Parnassius apollo]
MHRNIFFLSRCLLPNNIAMCTVRRFLNKSPGNEQMEYLKSALDTNFQDWPVLKVNILSKDGSVNEKNVDAVILKTMVRNQRLDSASSFANYLKSSNSVLSIGATNSILGLYFEKGRKKSLSESEKQFILNTYMDLYNKYKVLDYSTSESLLHALCAIDEWEKAFKVLDDLKLSCTPSHSAYSTLIGTLFKNNKVKEALDMINRSVSDLRPLQYYAYKEWMHYFLRKYKNKGTIIKHLDTICSHITENCAVISMATVDEMIKIYTSLGWNAEFVEVIKQSGQCISCNKQLKCLKLSNQEFELLQKNIKDKLIIGSDMFLKTSPKELNEFLHFVDETAPYDIVLDALNIAYAISKSTNMEKLKFLKTVVDYFNGKNKRILLLGRKHMLKWHRKTLEYLMSRTCSFFTEDISQDDPFFITAAIKWQWQHQWKVFLAGRRPIIQPPLRFSPCAQKNQDGWHLPYEKEAFGEKLTPQVNDGVPNYDGWLCLRPKIVVK